MRQRCIRTSLARAFGVARARTLGIDVTRVQRSSARKARAQVVLYDGPSTTSRASFEREGERRAELAIWRHLRTEMKKG